MKQKLIIDLIFLILIFQIIQANDELFGDRSIIRKLKDQLGSFISEIRIKDGSINVYQLLKEEYNFKDKSGRFHHSKSTTSLYLNDLSEYYFINENLYCYSTSHYRLIYTNILHYLIKYSPEQTINLSRSFEVLGPSHFLFSLISDYDENKENINCVNIDNGEDDADIRCDIIYERLAKIEYYFKENHNQFKMYPIKIRTFKKLNNKFILYNEINYIKFIYSFNGDFNRISSNLPIGVGCIRDDHQNVYPKIQTNFGNRFKLEYDIEFEYLDSNSKDNENYLKKNYSGIWFMDSDYIYTTIDGYDEQTNQKFRTYFDGESRLMLDVYDDGKCNKYNLKYGFNYSTNWYYFQDLILHPTLFNIGNDDDFSTFSYLGEYESYYTFEKIYKPAYSHRKKINGRKNDNEIVPYSVIINHYYSKSNNQIPELIQLNYLNYKSKISAITKIKINKHNLVSLSSDSFNEKIELDQCFKNLKSTDYKELNVAFKGNLKSFNDNYIKYEFRKLIDGYPLKFNLSPLRIYDIKLKKTNDLINITAKLLESIDSLNYFETIENLTLDESKIKSDDGLVRIIKSIDNEELCSRLCIQDRECAAFSFKKTNQFCKLWIDKGFMGDIDNQYGYNWNRVKIIKEKGNILGKRYIGFYGREHISIKNIFTLINKLISYKKFNLILKKSSNDKEIKFKYFVKSNTKASRYKFLICFIIFFLIVISLIIGIIKYRKRSKIDESNYPNYVNFRNNK